MILEIMLKVLKFKKWSGEKRYAPQESNQIIQYTYIKNNKIVIDYYTKK